MEDGVKEGEEEERDFHAWLNYRPPSLPLEASLASSPSASSFGREQEMSVMVSALRRVVSGEVSSGDDQQQRFDLREGYCGSGSSASLLGRSSSLDSAGIGRKIRRADSTSSSEFLVSQVSEVHGDFVQAGSSTSSGARGKLINGITS